MKISELIEYLQNDIRDYGDTEVAAVWYLPHHILSNIGRYFRSYDGRDFDDIGLDELKEKYPTEYMVFVNNILPECLDYLSNSDSTAEWLADHVNYFTAQDYFRDSVRDTIADCLVEDGKYTRDEALTMLALSDHDLFIKEN